MSVHLESNAYRWVPPLLLAGLCGALQIADWQMTLQFDRQALAQGELWRLLSGNLIHLGWPHWGMNIVGLTLIWWLFGEHLNLSRWVTAFLLIGIAVGAGIYIFNPELRWYVGLSGILHGLFVLGLCFDHAQTRLLRAGVFVLFCGKLVWEQYAGALPGSEATAGGYVVVDAHLYGAVAGILLCLVWMLRRYYRAG